MDIREKLSKVPAWGWIAGGGLVIGLFFLLNRGSSSSGSSTMTSSGGIAPDANSILSGLQDAANTLGNASGGSSSSGGNGNSGTPPPSGGLPGPTTTGNPGVNDQPPIRNNTPPPSGGTTTTTSAPHATSYTVGLPSGVNFYNRASGKIGGKITGVKSVIATAHKVNGKWWYQIISPGTYYGKWFSPVTGMTFTRTSSSATPLTTTSTSTIQSSNNTVK